MSGVERDVMQSGTSLPTIASQPTKQSICIWWWHFTTRGLRSGDLSLQDFQFVPVPVPVPEVLEPKLANYKNGSIFSLMVLPLQKGSGQDSLSTCKMSFESTNLTFGFVLVLEVTCAIIIGRYDRSHCSHGPPSPSRAEEFLSGPRALGCPAWQVTTNFHKCLRTTNLRIDQGVFD